MPASDRSGRQTAKDGKNEPFATHSQATLIGPCGNRAHGALLQVGLPICFMIER